MRNKFIESVEAARHKKETPKFDVGDTVSVGVRIIEGSKERIQPFIGVVIGRRGKGMNETFTVRRIVANEGVERVFPLQSPRIVSVEVQRRGKVRRGKLYFLRERVGKARKLRERRIAAAARAAAGEGAAPDGSIPSTTKTSVAPAKAEVAATV
ncbi:MAG TPA: 50S ribosomal protein L19 [Phycisphaerae bacterium]|nr:50S ribosomal protein L19 [Phycisphaerae bacterium]